LELKIEYVRNYLSDEFLDDAVPRYNYSLGSKIEKRKEKY
jgi:hypothetical protein